MCTMEIFRCVCKTCTADLKRQGNSEGYAPRWKRSKRLCTVSSCITKKDKVTNCKLLSVSAIQGILNDSCSSIGGQGSSDGVLLCQQHYHQVYRSIPSNHTKVEHKKCSVCSLNMKNMEARYCADPESVKRQIKDIHDLDIDLHFDSVICRSCYRFFSHIMKNPKSLDSNLKDLITSMQSNEEAISLTELDSCVQYSLIHTTRTIASSLYVMRQSCFHRHIKTFSLYSSKY